MTMYFTNSKTFPGTLAVLLGMLSATEAGHVAAATGNSLLINANSIQLIQSSKKMIYRGALHIRHKSLSIRGQRAVAIRAANGSRKISVAGHPVTATMTDPSGKQVTLFSKRLDYDSHSRALRATGNVSIQTTDGTIQGETVDYQLDSNRLRVSGTNDKPRVSARLSTSAGKQAPTGK